MALISLGTPLGPKASSCGYCKAKEDTNHHSAGLVAHQLAADQYMDMIDRGWRRSGTFCYKPDLVRSCCPQYPIRLDALAFVPSKSHRKLLNRWNRYVLELPKGPKFKAVDSADFDLVSAIHASEHKLEAYNKTLQPAHSFETQMESASFTEEKFALYAKYQTEIHHDVKSTPRGFTRFLVNSPLKKEPIPYPAAPPAHLPLHYGSYHQLYRLDGQLIALGVVDVLPQCVSSVYFIYDQNWDKHSLGKLSALREVCLAREMHDAGISRMKFLYMGYYVHSCPKMRYKGEYSPSYLADPETYDWFPIDSCVQQLDQMRYVSFSHPHHSRDDKPGSNESIGVEHLAPNSIENVQACSSISDGTVTVMPMTKTDAWDDGEEKGEILSCLAGLGPKLSQEIIFLVHDI